MDKLLELRMKSTNPSGNDAQSERQQSNSNTDSIGLESRGMISADFSAIAFLLDPSTIQQEVSAHTRAAIFATHLVPESRSERMNSIHRSNIN
ncbi:hypothetical protein [Mesorhizobium sp. M7A.F.Ca.US.008.03.1.1]|uniref:hypothetical protein n=1 Tax=Mesorhizobium sp. M7A.F.Ca.US.008.03.1.1 TaxID=2496742 RepID=UPI001FDF3CE9|nr:hypothetical protein [Mesorhizobium sp. M7A.F.Ca.US.008.03.1.1]